MNYRFLNSEKIRLDEFLRLELPKKLKNPENASNSKIRRLIVAGCVYVNGNQIRRPAFVLFAKSVIEVQFDEEKFFYEKQPEDIKFELTEENVLFEDEYLICVNKPALFPTEETIVGGEKRDNLHDAVVRYLWKKNPLLRNPPYAGIMHRLDRETSGVILFTKQRSVNKDIQKMFENHDFTKVYEAFCTLKNAVPGGKYVNCSEKFQKGRKFTVEKYIGRVSAKSQAAKWGTVPESRGGLHSKTDFTVLEEKTVAGIKGVLVQAELFTGRTHQIRVHLSENGLPILGDELYGGLPYKRILLHAKRLCFVHPVTKQRIDIECKSGF